MANEIMKFDVEDPGANLPDDIRKQLAEESRENLEGVSARLPRMRMPTGRGKEFSIERAAEEDLETKEFVGVMLYQTAANAYWKEPFGGGAAVIPDCASHDAIKPSSQYPDIQSDKCTTCRHNRFGSAKDPAGNRMPGKACRNVKRVILLSTSDTAIPVILTVPPSSIKEFDDYMVNLRKKQRPYFSVATKITVVTETNKTGIEYPHLKFEVAGYINDPVQLDQLTATKNEWIELLHNSMFASEDVPDNPPDGNHFTPSATTVSTKSDEF